MDLLQKEELKKYCNGFSNPVAIMDNNFRCAFCNRPRLIPQESSMMSVFQKAVNLPLAEVQVTLAMIKGKFYSARITPLDGELYICEFFDQNTVLSMAENTNIYDKILPIVNDVEFNTAALWRGYKALRDRLETEGRDDDVRCVLEFEKHLTGLNSVIKNASEYINMLFYTPESNSIVDLTSLMQGVVERCNTILAESGRYIDLVCEPEEIYINAQMRHVTCAVVNALQNALMYSPRECIPFVSLYKPLKNDDNCIILQILNDNMMYVDQKHGEEPGKNFDHQRLGYGIPIIQRFAELAGGSFMFGEKDGKVCAEIKLPMVDKDDCKKVGVFKNSLYVYFKTDIPDILELKMLEVNELFRI